MNDVTLKFIKYNLPAILETMDKDPNAAVIVCVVPNDPTLDCLTSVANAFPYEVIKATCALTVMCVDKGYDTKPIKKALKHL